MSKDIDELLNQLLPVLHSYKEIWSRETIYEYPNHLNFIPEELFNEIFPLSYEEIFLTLRTDNLSNNLPNISKLLSTLREATSLDNIPIRNYTLGITESRYITPKKKHEIERIFDILLPIHKVKKISRITDCCGGAGYLANSLANILNSEVTSIDNDSVIQKNGLKKFLKHGECNVSYSNNDFNIKNKQILDLVKDSDLVIGIHTCAHLSDVQLQLAIDSNAKLILNVGCCYYKTKGYNYGLSQMSKSANIKLTGPSLLLAARGIETDLDNFLFSINVKKYRYLLHIYLTEVLGLGFKSVGGLKPREYSQTFDDYAVSRINTLGLKGEEHREKLINFQSDAKKQKLVKEMITVNAIRSIFSRIVEVYIALDRAKFLEESGYESKIFECFDPKISPRNICVIGVQK